MSDHAPFSRLLSVCLFLFCVLGTAAEGAAQSFTNPGFESGTTGWTCAMEVNSASVYGGPGSNKVAEVDGHTNPNSTADDRLLCQTLTGFTVGAVYMLEFDATRRPNASTPATVSVNISMGSALQTTISRTGGWNMVHERILFSPTSTSHAFRITPNFTVSFGMLFDNFNVTMVSPLPVELARFDAWPAAGAVELEWATASERDNAYFSVERSADLAIWEPISIHQGAGNSQSLIVYNATDGTPLEGLAYYRLRQVDLDGSEVLSEVVAVRFSNGGTALTVWPNPARDRVFAQVDAEGGPVRFLNALGQPVIVVQVRNGNVVSSDISSLPRGAYFIHAIGSRSGTARFIKE